MRDHQYSVSGKTGTDGLHTGLFITMVLDLEQKIMCSYFVLNSVASCCLFPNVTSEILLVSKNF